MTIALTNCNKLTDYFKLKIKPFKLAKGVGTEQDGAFDLNFIAIT